MKLTVHSIVKNEPFLWYSIRSVYDYADVIFLYDTGSYDVHTLEDIQALLDGDIDKKIVYKQVLTADETQWSVHTLLAKRGQFKGQRVVGHVRRQQIEETKTPFFMILDGDEVHYAATMKEIRKTIEHWPDGKVCGFVQMIWFIGLDSVLNFVPLSWSGRVFLTEQIDIRNDTIPLGELAVHKPTRAPIVGDGRTPYPFRFPNTMFCAHFEPFLKPWRKREEASYVKGRRHFGGHLPEVIEANRYYVERFLRGQEGRASQ